MRKKDTMSKKKIDKFVKLYPLNLENKLYPTNEELITPEIEKAMENLAHNFFGFYEKNKDIHERKD